MHVTATQAKNQFGAMCLHAKTEPVFVEKDGRVETVIISAQQFAVLSSAVHQASLADKKKAFEKTYKVWLDHQNAQVEKHGLWCDELRIW